MPVITLSGMTLRCPKQSGLFPALWKSSLFFFLVPVGYRFWDKEKSKATAVQRLFIKYILMAASGDISILMTERICMFYTQKPHGVMMISL
jgi:hypothetical protein